MNSDEIADLLRGMLQHDRPLGLHTLKATVLTEDKSRVEAILEHMKQGGEIVEVKRHKYQRKEPL